MRERDGAVGTRVGVRRRIALLGAVIAGGGFLWLTRTLEQTGDSLSYAEAIRSKAELFHPHHLLFNPVVVVVRELLKTVWPGVSEIAAAQVHNILWALAGGLALAVIVRRLSGTWVGGGIAAGGLLASYGFWHYATLVEVYIPAMGALAVTLAWLLTRPSLPAGLGRQAVIGLGFAVAVLYHQMFLLWAVPLVVLFIGKWGRRAWPPILRILFIAGGLIAAVYAAAYATTGGPASIRGFIQWFFEYANHPHPGWGTMRNVSILGLAKLLLSQALDMVYVVERLYLPAAALYGLALLALIGWNAIQIVRRASDAALRLFAMVWIAVYNVFLLWWSPFGYELSIHLLLPVILLAALALRDLGERRPRPARAARAGGAVAAGIIILIGGWNAWTAIGPKHRDPGPAFARAAHLDQIAPRDAIFVTDWEVGQNLRYYRGRDRVLWIDVAGYSFFQHLRLPPDYDLEATRPVVVAGESLDPDSRALKPYTADTHPGEWLAFLGWMLDVRSGGASSPSCRRVSLLTRNANDLVLGAERIPLTGLADLCGILDEALGGRLFAPPDPFRRWLSRHPELPPQQGWPILSPPVAGRLLTSCGEGWKGSFTAASIERGDGRPLPATIE
jgi:hypothetical protein